MSCEDTSKVATRAAEIEEPTEGVSEATETLEPAELQEVAHAWDEEFEDEWQEDEPRRVVSLLRGLDGHLVPVVITAVAVAAVSIAATLMLTAPRGDRFNMLPGIVEQAPPKAPPPPEAVPAPPPPAAPPVPAHPDQAAPPASPPPDAHQQFTQALQGDKPETVGGNGLHPNQPPDVINAEAQEMCQDLANGGSIQPYIDGTLQKSPSLAPWQAALVVHQAIQAYCPQYDR